MNQYRARNEKYPDRVMKICQPIIKEKILTFRHKKMVKSYIKMKIQINVSIQIQKPNDQVFEAIVNPEHMCQYFISASSGKMEEGAELIWNFPEFNGDVPIRVGKITPNLLVTYYWSINDVEVEVALELEERADGSTVVRITEKEMENDEAGISWVKGNTEGWANFSACLKAYLEYGINLRKGAFIYRFDKK